MIVIEVWFDEVSDNKEPYTTIYAKYFGQYTANLSGYEYYIGNRYPVNYSPGFIKQWIRDAVKNGAKFCHISNGGKWLSADEVLKVLGLEVVE